MNNRQTLYLLMGLTAVVGIGRLYVGSEFRAYEDGLENHEKAMQEIYETVDELNVRRSRLPAGETEDRINQLFQEWSQKAQMGFVKATERSGSGRSRAYEDRIFGLEFEREDQAFSRSQIVIFLHSVERDMPRMRSTALSMQPATDRLRGSRGIPTGGERNDVWRVTNLSFTRRTPVSIQ